MAPVAVVVVVAAVVIEVRLVHSRFRQTTLVLQIERVTTVAATARNAPDA